MASPFHTALPLWEQITETPFDGKTWSLGVYSVSKLNRSLRRVLDQEPSGVTAGMMLEAFVRAYLSDKSFTVRQMMENYDAVQAYLAKSHDLMAILQSEEANAIISDFKVRLKTALGGYEALTEDVAAMVDNQDLLPFLRRDALASMENLVLRQFLSGPTDPAPAGVFRHIYMTYSLNDAILAARDMTRSGIFVVLVRDAENPGRSFFAFFLRNGANVIMMTDRHRYEYPTQAAHLAARGGDMRGFMAREHANHFPYQIIPHDYDEEGEIRFEAESGMVAGDERLVRLMPFAALPADQIIWITMMISLIEQKFWKMQYQADVLSYTNAMIQKPQLAIEGSQLPARTDYRPINAPALTTADMRGSRVEALADFESQGVNSWLEDIYATGDLDALGNLWGGDEKTFLLPFLNAYDQKPQPDVANLPAGPLGTVVLPKDHKALFPFGIKGVVLHSLSENDFGTEAELLADRAYIARKNLSEYVRWRATSDYQKHADELRKQLKETGENLYTFFGKPVKKAETATLKDEKGEDCLQIIRHDITASKGRYDSGPRADAYCGHSRTGAPRCVENDGKASWAILVKPLNEAGLAIVLGRKEVPPYLKGWRPYERSAGNHLLNRMDPMDYMASPWKAMSFSILIHMSKTALKSI